MLDTDWLSGCDHVLILFSPNFASYFTSKRSKQNLFAEHNHRFLCGFSDAETTTVWHQYFCGSLILRMAIFLCVFCGTNFCDWGNRLFFLGINFCDFPEAVFYLEL